MNYTFDLPNNQQKSIIKVVGVGGGGSNAVNHMYQQGITGVEFIVCNTDAQHLKTCAVPNKLQIGTNLTEGLGAGTMPERGRQSALEDKDSIVSALEGSKMLFITAGMGGGTGTGAAPVIAKIAKELGILTVGIVTLPFTFEGKKKREIADSGIEALKEFCDTVIIILNDKIREIYGNLNLKQAFSQADNILTTAAKYIAEIITNPGLINIDFEDVNMVMQKAGAAVMGSATASGKDRAIRAAESALNSPLLNNTNIHGAKKILVSISVTDTEALSMDEYATINDYLQETAGMEALLKCGVSIDPNMGENLTVTVIATGFEEEKKETVEMPPQVQAHVATTATEQNAQAAAMAQTEHLQHAQHTATAPTPASDLPLFSHTPEVVKIIDLESQKVSTQQVAFVTPTRTQIPVSYEPEPETPKVIETTKGIFAQADPQEKIVVSWEGPALQQKLFEEEAKPKVENAQTTQRYEQQREALEEQYLERKQKIQSLTPFMQLSNDEIKKAFEEPAYLRKNVNLQDVPHSSERVISNFNLNEDNELLGNNKFLFDNVD